VRDGWCANDHGELATRFGIVCTKCWLKMNAADRDAHRSVYRLRFGDVAYQIEVLAELSELVITYLKSAGRG
jgi:hypothetical protein